MDNADVVAGAVFLTTPDAVGTSPWTIEPLSVVPVAGHRIRVIGDQAAFVSLLDGSFGADDTMVALF